MSNSSPLRQLVRVRVGAAEVTVAAGYADAKGLVPLDKPAVDAYGNALPAKPVTPAAAPAGPVPAGRGNTPTPGKEN